MEKSHISQVNADGENWSSEWNSAHGLNSFFFFIYLSVIYVWLNSHKLSACVMQMHYFCGQPAIAKEEVSHGFSDSVSQWI